MTLPTITPADAARLMREQGVARQPFWEFPTSILGTLPCAPPRPSDVIETPLRRPCHYPPDGVRAGP